MNDIRTIILLALYSKIVLQGQSEWAAVIGSHYFMGGGSFAASLSNRAAQQEGSHTAGLGCVYLQLHSDINI